MDYHENRKISYRNSVILYFSNGSSQTSKRQQRDIGLVHGQQETKNSYQIKTNSDSKMGLGEELSSKRVSKLTLKQLVKSFYESHGKPILSENTVQHFQELSKSI